MFFNKSLLSFVFAMFLVVGLTIVAAQAQTVTPVLSVTDELADDPADPDTLGIQVYGLRAESVPFDLTVTFQDTNNANTPVNGFDASDITLHAADGNGLIVPNGATAAPVRSNVDGSVYTTTITAKGNINNVFIRIPAEAAEAALNIQQIRAGATAEATEQSDQMEVKIIRSAAPPLILSPDKSVGGNAPFTVTLTSTQAITLTSADLKVTGGSIDSLTPDTARRVWTVTIRPGVGITQLTVSPTATGSFIFPKGTFTIDTTGPVATVSGTPPVGGGAFVITIAFDEPLQTGATLLKSEIAVVDGSISDPIAISNTNTYVATLTPDSSATTVTVQVNAGAVADAGGIQNEATPSPAHTFRVNPTTAPPETTRGRGEVAISEIMFATDGSTNEVQWIEIFNSSKTKTVALDANSGWRLIIENYDDPKSKVARVGRINFKNDGDVKTIPPRQAVLIVSSTGRNSDRAHFTSTRVFDVYAELATEFGMDSRRDPFLHPTKGFHIELVDGRNETADEVGNLDGRTRTSDKPAWKLPNGRTAGGHRTSILRRYRDYNPRGRTYSNEGIVHTGTRRDAWIPAADTKLSYVNRKSVETWYGRNSDYGTPGIHAGGALPVQLAHFRPERTEAGTVLIKWTTESEVDNAGFNILRAETRKDVFKVVNAQLIPGAGTTAERNIYTWTDTTAKPNVVYYYQIEDVSFAGERQTLATSRLKGTISANGKLATRWAGLKSQD